MSSPLLVAYRALGLGDFLTAVPALRALARSFPAHRRVLAAPAAIAPLVALSGAVDEVVDAAALAPLPPALRGADVSVNLHGRGPQSHRVLLAARPRALIAFASGGVAGPEWRAGEHEVARWCRLLAESGVPADPRELDLPAPPGVAAPAGEAGGCPAVAGPADGTGRSPGMALPAGVTVLHPGAADAARRWPADRWAAVARAERAAGRAVVLTGSPGERELAERIAAAAGLGAEAVLAGRTDLIGLAGVVAGAGRVACGDTGVAHLATAFDVPSVVLFGPTPPAEWGPPADRPRHRALWAGGRGDPHAPAPDPGLLAITEEQVVGALEALPPVPGGRLAA